MDSDYSVLIVSKYIGIIEKGLFFSPRCLRIVGKAISRHDLSWQSAPPHLF